VHAPSLWDVFRDLALAILPAVASPIVGVRDEKPIYGPYTDRDSALAVFEPHLRHLVHDAFLEFGIIFQHRGATEEIFVPYAKYLRIWTNKPADVRSVFFVIVFLKCRTSNSSTTTHGSAAVWLMNAATRVGRP